MTTRRRIAVAISGRGMNLSALHAASKEAGAPFEIAGVVSDNPDAAGLVFAQTNGIAAKLIRREDFASRGDHDAAIHEAFMGFGAEFVVLAGYMRVIGPVLVDRWSGRMVNIHPSLLPSFKGLDTHRRAIEAGARVHGCTVHFVTAAVDDGPIIAQAAVPVLLSDDSSSLAARVLKAEIALYPKVVAMLADGTVRLENGRTAFLPARVERGGSPPLLSPDFEPGAANIEDLARFTP